jgi:putative zinc finger/helix-turn-helix YgiT family protein
MVVAIQGGMVTVIATPRLVMRRCPACGGRVLHSTKDEWVEVAGRRFVASVPAHACAACSSMFVDSGSMAQVENAVSCELAKTGPASGETFRYMRKSLGMRAAVLAKLLGITAETISRWENEQRAVDGTAWIVLGALVLENARVPPATFERLKVVSEPPRRRVAAVRIMVPSAPRVARRAASR